MARTDHETTYETTDASALVLVRDAPASQEAIVSALSLAGFEVLEDADTTRRYAAAVISIDASQPDSLVTSLTVHGLGVRIVGTVSSETSDTIMNAMRLGVMSVVPRSNVELIVYAVRAALTGHSVLPWAALRQLVAARTPTARISPADAVLLALLADGRTVTSIAAELQVAERTVYRRIDSVVAKLNVDNRHAALVVAAQLGIITARSLTRRP